MKLLDIFDYILLPVYLALFIYVIVLIRRKYYSNSLLGKSLLAGFIAKILGSILFALFFQYYYNGGDSYIYYTGGLDFKETILTNFPKNIHFLFSSANDFGDYYIQTYDKKENFGYLSAPSNLMAAKFVAFFALFCFNKYLIISLCFGVFSFSGMWVTFKIFFDHFPSLRKHFSIAFLYLPSLLFWGSGIGKDPLCIGFLGWLFYSGYKIFIKGELKLLLLLVFILSMYFLAVLKIYIPLVFISFFLLWIVLKRLNKIQNRIIRILIPGCIIVAIIILLNTTFVSEYINNLFDNFTQYIGDTKSLYEQLTSNEGSLINVGDFDLTPLGVLKKIPSSLATTLYRPYLWESKKLITFLSALESSYILLYTLYALFKTRIYGFFIVLFQNSILLFSFFFSIVFAIFIGLTCFNFGTLVRYKIPCIPFYLSSLMIIIYLFSIRQNKKKISIK